MAEKTKATSGQAGKTPMMPANVRAGQVISLVEITGGLGPTIDASRLADELGADIAVLLPILDAAEMLGLVKSDKGDVSLTEFGVKFQKVSKQKVRLLSGQLARVEPFRTAMEMCAKGTKTTAREVAEALRGRGLKWHHEPELNESLIQTLLVHWSIYAGLLNYDGRTGKFEKV